MVPKGDRIRQLRKARGWTQAELAGACAANNRTIQRAESCKSDSLETITAIASALEVDLSEILLPECPPPAERHDVRREIEEHVLARAQRDQENDENCDLVATYWERIVPGCTLSGSQRADLHKWLSQFAVKEILVSMDICESQYVDFEENGVCTKDSADLGFSKIPAVCHVTRRSQADPIMRDLYIIRGIAQNRIPGYFNKPHALRLLKAAYDAGVTIQTLRATATTVSNWSQFRGDVEDLKANPPAIQPIDRAEEGDDEGEDEEQPIRPNARAPVRPSKADGQAAVRPIAATAMQSAAGIVGRGLREGEQFITIDADEREFHFGRARNGYGTTYPLEQRLTLEELARAIEDDFQYAE